MSQRLFAQVRFETALNWEQTKQKAAAERKLIFIDVYATYCKPCKEMDQSVFSSSKAGTFFNEHFVNLKVQVDETKNDDAYIVSWRPRAKQLVDKYKVQSYPTYLFFNEKGVLVYEVKGGDLTIDSFIEKCKPALEQNVQLMTMKMQYGKGDKDPQLILSMNKLQHLEGNKPALDIFSPDVKDKPDSSSIKLLFNHINEHKDKIKYLCIKYPQVVDSVNGRGVAAHTLRDIVIYNEIYPMFSAGKPIEDNGGMLIMPPLVIPDINKEMVLGYVESAYPGHGQEFLLGTEYYFYETKGDKAKALSAYLELVKSFPSRVSLSDVAMLVYQFSSYDVKDKAAIDSVIHIAKTWIDYLPGETSLWYSTGVLMYKNGDSDSAILILENLHKKLRSENEKAGVQQIINKMKRKESI